MRLSTIAFCLVATSSALASETGFYAGGTFGAESLTSKMENPPLTTMIDSYGNEGHFFGGFVGYQFPLTEGLFMSIEAEYQVHNTEAKYKLGSFEEETSFKNEYTASVLLGHSYSDNVDVYGRLGAANAKFEGKTSVGDQGNDRVNGWLFGIGTEFKNQSPMSLRAEYRYSKYGEINFDNSIGVGKSPRSHSLALSGIYRF